MRGKVPCLRSSSHRCRITPAYAGKRTTLDCLEVLRRDHPRICGEKFIVHPRRILQAGSPPHMRGKETKFLSGGMAERITPAYAGKSVLLVFQSAVNRDHPRICGEKLPRTLRPSPRKGSPPHMRGKVNEKKANGFDIRITPAYAGKSTLLCFPAEPGWDHPRICGEKRNSLLKLKGKLGSPPHMRGKVPIDSEQVEQLGITPAYAGKSNCGRWRYPAQRDHPRICGEKTKKIP